MQEKLFRNCPYELEYAYEFECDCSNCPLYRDICSPRKQALRAERAKARAERAQLRAENMRKMTVLLLTIFVVVVAILIYAFCSDAKQSDKGQEMQSENFSVQMSTANSMKDAIVLNETHGFEAYSKKQEADPVEKISFGAILAQEAGVELVYCSTTVLTKEEAEVTKENFSQISFVGPSEEYYYTFSKEEKVCIAKLVYAEARGEEFKGKVAVAAVAINRYFSDISWYDCSSIYAVITQKYQFADISGVTMQDLENNPECMEAVEAACKGWDPTREVFPEGARYFYAPDLIGPEEASRREGVLVLQIGGHNFHNDFAN